MKTMIKDEAYPRRQHALPPHDRVCVFQVCVFWGWYSDRWDAGLKAMLTTFIEMYAFCLCLHVHLFIYFSNLQSLV